MAGMNHAQIFLATNGRTTRCDHTSGRGRPARSGPVRQDTLLLTNPSRKNQPLRGYQKSKSPLNSHR